MRIVAIAASLICLVVFSSTWADSLPSIHDVYVEAQAGHLTQARAMVDQVLAAKPDSAKGHFVKAEICSVQSDISCVRDEFANAKRLDPGLSFANPATVNRLETFASGVATIQPKSSTYSGSLWGWLLLGLGIIVLLWWVTSASRRRAAQNAYPAAPVPYGNGAMMPTTTTPAGGMSSGYGAPMQSGGFGTSLGKSLATGAALGAGLVAGEALADGLMHRGQDAPPLDPHSNTSESNPMPPDLGGSDFGVSDTGSWDSSSDLGSMDMGGSDW